MNNNNNNNDKSDFEILQEKIAKQLKFDYTHTNLKQSYMSQADKILRIITKHGFISQSELVKRIDEMISDYHYPSPTKKEIPDYSHYNGFVGALNRVKKEMLK